MNDETLELVEDRETVGKVPVELRELKDAAGIGLFYLAIGERPQQMPQVPESECKSTRFKLSPRAQQYLTQVKPNFGSERAALVAALALVAELPAHVRLTRI